MRLLRRHLLLWWLAKFNFKRPSFNRSKITRNRRTVVQNRLITFPRAREWVSERMKERSGTRKRSRVHECIEQGGASEWVVRANRQTRGLAATRRTKGHDLLKKCVVYQGRWTSQYLSYLEGRPQEDHDDASISKALSLDIFVVLDHFPPGN